MKNSQDFQDMLEEYYRLHRQQTAILAWQAGDSFEFYFEEAERVASLLGVALTTRGFRSDGRSLPMCSIPSGGSFTVQGGCLLVPLVPADHAFGKIVQTGLALAVAVHAPEPRSAPHDHRIAAVFYPEDWSRPKVGGFITLMGKISGVSGVGDKSGDKPKNERGGRF